jgi:hypothetical protein
MTRLTVILATVALVVATAASARAQTLAAGELGVGTGLEGGDPGTGHVGFHGARTRIFAGADFRFSDFMAERLGAMVFADVVPHTGLGGSVRYLHFLGAHAVVFAGVTGAFAPHTLLGGEVGAKIVLGGQIKLFLEPSFAALPLGTDLPSDKPLLWALLGLGMHVEL